jgi:hypothetical protein
MQGRQIAGEGPRHDGTAKVGRGVGRDEQRRLFTIGKWISNPLYDDGEAHTYPEQR